MREGTKKQRKRKRTAEKEKEEMGVREYVVCGVKECVWERDRECV